MRNANFEVPRTREANMRKGIVSVDLNILKHRFALLFPIVVPLTPGLLAEPRVSKTIVQYLTKMSVATVRVRNMTLIRSLVPSHLG